MCTKILTFWLLLISVCSCDSFKTDNQKVGPPKIKFFSDTLNFGKIRRGDSAMVCFRFENIGYGALEINHLELGCSCCVTEFSNLNHKFYHGEGDKIFVQYLNGKDFRDGVITKIFVVQSNALPSINVLTIQGLVQ